MLLDTSSLFYRAFFGVPSSFTSPTGEPVNAVRGLLDFMARLIRDYSPTHVIACWDDDWRPAFRTDAVPSYKAHRVADTGSEENSEEVPEQLRTQIPMIINALAAFGIARVGVAGFEADDVIASYCVRAQGPVRIVTGDRDLFALVNDTTGVAVLYTAARGVGRAELVNDEWISNKYDIPIGTYLDFALMRGDTSDGLPGIKGVGDRTAANLLREFGSLPAIRQAAADDSSSMRGSVRTKVLAAAEYLGAACAVIPPREDVPLPVGISGELSLAGIDSAALGQLGERLGIESSIERLRQSIVKATR